MLHAVIEHAPEVHPDVALARAQATLHDPQVLGEASRLASQPLEAMPSQLPQPALQLATSHAPPEHAAVALASLQAAPHAPQLAVDVVTLTSHPLAATPSQFAYPVLQTKPQTPEAHTAEELATVGQTVPHIPQLRGSVAKTAHELDDVQ